MSRKDSQFGLGIFWQKDTVYWGVFGSDRDDRDPKLAYFTYLADEINLFIGCNDTFTKYRQDQ